jgi:serine phosphatase RsbU (regulator of sigma subunit)
MTIRRRLTLSYAALLFLFGCNLAIYLWTSGLRTRSMQTLDNARTRQVLLASVRQELDNLHKQVSLLSGMDFEAGQDSNTPEARLLFQQKLDVVGRLLAQFRDLAEPADLPLVTQIQENFKSVSTSWKEFYEYLGVEQSWAVASAIKGEAPSIILQTKLVPALQKREDQHAQAAQARFTQVETLADRLSILFFAVSALIAIAVAVLVSRHLSRGFGVLKHGADLIGNMDLEHRIQLKTADELGSFAQSFNSMADKLLHARNELTEANAELERRAEEIAHRQQRELELAATIQQGLMQVRIPDLPFAKIAGRNISCTQIGGDFFDVVHTPEGLAVIICDVSGKGISAAIMASVIQGTIRADLAARVPLAEIAAGLNRFFCQREVGGKYATLVIMRLAPSGHLEYVNCGHIYPVVINGDKVSRLEASNVPIGLLDDEPFESAKCQVRPGNRIILVTDGVTEAANAAEDFFGDERLEAATSAPDPFEGIFIALHTFCAGTPFNDDCTVVEVAFVGDCNLSLSDAMAAFGKA